jgi:predicted amidohydrolase
MARRAEAPVTVAVVQMEPRVGEKAHNLERSVELLHEAADRGANLVTLPELASSGYVFQSREEVWELAEEVPCGPTTEAWLAVCRERNLHLVAGIAERDGAALYNSAVVLGPGGYIGAYRKTHLWGDEALYFERGNLGFPVFQTRLGRIGTFICYDGWFPEAYRLCAIQGAEIVCIPTNWVPIPGQDPTQRAMANILCMANAHANSVFVAAAARVGTERGQPFIGQSVIVSYTGWPLAGPASGAEEEILLAEINLADARRKRNWNDFNQPLRDRRTDIYDQTLGADVPVGFH